MLLAMNQKIAATLCAVLAYVATGSAAFHLVSSISGDAELANWLVAFLSLPLAAPLSYAVGWIEEHL